MATEVKYLSDTLRMIRNCDISPQHAREEVRFLINLIDARIAANKSRGRYADIDDAFNEQPAPTKDFVDHLKRRAEREPAVKAALESRDEQPAPAPAGDVPEWFQDIVRQAWSAGRNMFPLASSLEGVAWQIAESEIARRVAEATKDRDAETQKSRRLALEWGDKLTQRDAEIERLKAALTKWESEPVGKLITDLRDEERESKNADIKKLRSKIDELLNENAANVEENDRLKAELAATTKPVELESANIRELDGMKMICLGDAQAAVRCERAARLAAERRLALTREAWRHRWVGREGNDQRERVLTDADIDAAIEAHQKSKADAAGGPQ